MPDGALQGRRILVVEDEYFLADELGGALRRAGAALLGPVASVPNALRLLAEGPAPEAACLDVNLGGADVYPLADALVARSVPFVFSTGYDQAAIPGRFAHIRRLEKPVEAGMVLAALAALLRG